MTINEKIFLENDRHIKKIEELKVSLELEYILHKKNMDELRKEEEKERFANFCVTPQMEEVDFSQLQPLPFDDTLKISEGERVKINQQLQDIVKHAEEMKAKGINIQNDSTESFDAQSPALSQLEMLAGGAPIITPEYDQEQLNDLFDSRFKGKVR